MRNINPTTEKLRRKKISKTIKEKFRKGEWKVWNKGKTIKTDERIKKIRYWLGKRNPEHSKRMKGHIPWNKGLKGYMAGEKNVNWKGGISPENVKIRNSIEMREWRNKVFKRDKYACQVCGKIGGKLNVHHLKSFSKYPELRFDVKNGITLCEKCHSKTPNYKNLKNPANAVNSERTMPS